jgi:hypothetical protein
MDRVVESLARRYSASEKPSSDLAVAMIGYRTGADGQAEFRPLIPGSRPEGVDWLEMKAILSPPSGSPPAWISASRLGERTVRPRPGKGPRHWTEVATRDALPTNSANPADAMLLAHRLVYLWLRFHDCLPPLILHCTDDQPPDAETARLTRSLTAMSTRWGPVGVVHCLFGDGFPRSDGSAPADDRLRDLWEASSPLLPRIDARPPEPRRGLTVENWPLRSIAAMTTARDAPVESTAEPEPPQVKRVHALVTAKDGAITECEDSHALDATQGRFVVTDGSGEGFQVKSWAKILAEGFVESQPNFDDPKDLEAWVVECRTNWRTTFDIRNLRYNQLERMERFGGAATLIGLVLDPSPTSDGLIPWRAWAVGDACLFVVRDGRVCLGFPIADPVAFSAPPQTLRTKADLAMPKPIRAQGRARPGDLLVLASDAVAQWITSKTVHGEAIDWDAFWTWDWSEWTRRVQSFRNGQGPTMKIDDSTLLLIEIGTPPPIAPEPEPESVMETAIPDDLIAEVAMVDPLLPEAFEPARPEVEPDRTAEPVVTDESVPIARSETLSKRPGLWNWFQPARFFGFGSSSRE